MRVAILISGHIRSFEQSQENIKLLRALFPKSDLFIHTWDSSEMIDNSHHKPYFGVTKITEKLLELFNPKASIIENQIEIDLDKSFNLTNNKIPTAMWPAIKGYYWMIYGISKCTELMIHEEVVSRVKYDYVIRYRFDLICENRNSIMKDFGTDKFYDNSIILSTNKIWWPLGVYSDVYWIAPRLIHERIINSLNSSIYDNVLTFKDSQIFLPELVLTSAIHKLKINIISSSGLFKLRRLNENHLISRNNYSIISKYRDLRFCWDRITSKSAVSKLTLLSKDEILKIEWRKNVFFPLNLDLFAKSIFFFISFINRSRNIFKTN